MKYVFYLPIRINLSKYLDSLSLKNYTTILTMSLIGLKHDILLLFDQLGSSNSQGLIKDLVLIQHILLFFVVLQTLVDAESVFLVDAESVLWTNYKL